MYNWSMKIINDFDGEEEYEYLSNFYPAKFTLIDIEFSNVEQYFQYMKAMFFNDVETANKILQTSSPSIAKSLGREIENFDEYEWERKNIQIMYDGVLAKFLQNKDLAYNLLQTGSSLLVEGNQWQDDYWGVVNGEGQNNLGIILMRVRSILWRLDKWKKD